MAAGINTVRFTKHPVQERKLNFFVDYYRYYVHFAGLLPDYQIETPLSLVDKILFQLNHNSIEKCPVYLKNHFSKLAAYPIIIRKHFDKYNELISFYKGWLSARAKSGYLKDQLSTLLSLANELHKDLSDNMLKDSISFVTNKILCTHPLEKHQKDLQLHAGIVAAEIMMIRNSKAEARELFDAVMTNDYKKFPYPKHISTEKDRRRYFDEKTIVETLSAINDFSTVPILDWEINFKIDDLTLPHDYIFMFNKVKIYPAGHFDKKTMVDSLLHSDDSFVQSFFKGSEYAIGEVQAQSVTYEGAHRKAVKELTVALDYVNQMTERSIRFKKGNYLFTTNRINYGYWFKEAYLNNIITHIDKMKLEDNAYSFFERISSKAKDDFLNMEADYIKARGDHNIARLWQYLEVMFTDGTQEKGIKKFCSGALMLFEKQYRVPHIYGYLRNAIHPINSRAENIGLTIDEQTTFIRTNSDFKELRKKIKSDFFHLGLQDLYLRKTSKWVKSQRETYYSLLEEIYEQRNMADHGGKMNERAITKLTYVAPLLTARMRWVLFDYIKRFPNHTYKQIIQTIRNDINQI